MVATTYLALTLAAPLTIHGLVFKAVSKCYYSPPPEGGSGYKRALALEARNYDIVDLQDVEKRQTYIGCDDPFLQGFADDGSQLTFNSGDSNPGLASSGHNCWATNGNYAGAAYGVDSSPGHYDGGLLKFQACCGIAYGVDYKLCEGNLNGEEVDKSSKTNCNGCKANGLTDSCQCCAVFF